MTRLTNSMTLVLFLSTLMHTAPALAEESGFDLRKKADASVDRNILFPTAETVNQGDITINDYEIFFLGMTYGIKNNLQISATTLLPITSDIPLTLLTAVKWNFFRTDRILLSFQPFFNFATKSGDTIGGFGGGIIMDILLDDRGDYVVTIGENNTMLFGGFDEDEFLTDGFLFSLSAGFNARVGKSVKLMAELSFPGGYNWKNGDFEILEEALLFNYGIRFFGETIAVDLSFLRPIHPDVQVGSLLMGFPYLTFSARF